MVNFKNMFDLIIIGAGPAGLTAAIYAARKKLNFKILAQKIGGEQVLATRDIENWPGTKLISGQEFIQNLIDHLKAYGIEVEEGKVVSKIEKKGEGFLLKLKTGEEYSARSIIIASGKRPRHLEIPGEKEFEGKGVSFCSICDAPLFSNKVVAVIGSGNAGLESALDLTRYAKKIYVLEIGPKIVGDELLQERLKKTSKVEFILNALSRKIEGEKFVSSLIYQDKNSKEIKELKVDGVFVHIGSVPSVDFLKGFLEINSANEIVIDPKTNQTSIEGIFAAGDVTDVKWKQIVVAAGEGAKAALSAYEYLKGQLKI